jgi:hypothetical protein
MHKLAQLDQRGRIADRPAASSMAARGDISGRSAPSQELLHEGQTDPKERGNGTLGAEPLVTGAENLLSKVK